MTQTPCPIKTTTFFQTLQQTPGLDTRDNRGKKHSIALVINGVVLALCCGRDGNLSSLHRHLVSKFKILCQATGQESANPISRAQLPLLLAKVNGVLFAKLLFDWCGLELDADMKRWFARFGGPIGWQGVTGKYRIRPYPDGRPLPARLAYRPWLMTLKRWSNRPTTMAPKRPGCRRSEKPTVRQLLNDTGLYNQKLTLDALHRTGGPINPLTINAIHGAGGVYVIGLKSNQAQLYRHCLCRALVNQAAYERTDVAQRGHGRIDQRSYRCFTLVGCVLAPRWKDAGLNTLIIVIRSRKGLDGSLLSEVVTGPPVRLFFE